MSHVRLEFPVLVEAITRKYQIQPLLFQGLQHQHERYAKAIEKFRKALRKQFKPFELDRETLAELLWYTFNPESQLIFRDFSIRYGKRHINGHFAIVLYELNQVRYACFPKLDHLTVIISTKNDALDNFLFDNIQEYFRKLRKKEGDQIDLDSYNSPKTASITVFKTSLNVKHCPFPFEQPDFNFLELLDQHKNLNGEQELNKVGQDFNERYPDELADAYCRQAQVESLMDMVYQAHPTCFALIGPHGCGKSTLIQATVKQYFIQQKNVSFQRRQKLWHLDPLRVISGMSVIGMWQRRVESIIEYIRFRLHKSQRIDKADILYINNVVALFRIGKSSQNSLTLADVLKPYLEKRAFTLIIEATPEEWQKAQVFDRKFSDLFEIIRIEQPNPATALQMLTWQRAQLEKNHRCQFTTEALTSLWELRHQFAGDEVLPGSISRVLKQIATRANADDVITKKDIYRDYQSSHKFQQRIFDPDIPLDSESILAELEQQLVGQDAVKQCLVNTIHVIKARLADPKKPLASLLFIGPTGVGKTEAAKVLTRYLFTNKDKQLLRFDMNEYVDGGAPARLIGDSFRPEGQLTTQVRFHKSCVLLLDEIEKAHPLVHDLLLQVLGEGRLTDALGRTTDFSQCIVIMTSNLGAAQATHQMGFARHENDQQQTYNQAVQQFFRPELLNRIDEQISFTPLSLPQAIQLTRQQIRRLLARNGFTRRTMFFNVNDDTLEAIARQGFDPQMGGRSLKRNIERALTALSADQLVTMQPDKPVLLEIYRDPNQHNQLRPYLLPLDYEQRQTTQLTILVDDQLADALLKLFDRIETMEEHINNDIDHADEVLRIDYWTVKEQLLDLKQHLSGLHWDINNWQQRGQQLSQFQIKQKTGLNPSWRWGKQGAHELHAEQDIADYFQELYVHAEELKELTNNFVLQQQQEFDYINLLYHATNAQTETIIISIIARIESYQESSQFFVQQYQTLLTSLLIDDIQIIHRGSHTFLIASGHGLFNFLRAETGIHLLQTQQLLLFQIGIHCINTQAQPFEQQLDALCVLNKLPPKRPNPGKIIRLYTETGDSTLMTDFRTGLMCKETLKAEDWKLLLLSRLPNSQEQRP